MIIFLYGKDDWRREEKKRAVIAEFLKKHSALGFGKFDFAEEGHPDRFMDFIRNQSMFEPLKLVVLENAFEGDAALLAKEFALVGNRASVTLILSESEEPPKELEFLIAKPENGKSILSQEFKPLAGYEWEQFIRGEAKRRELALTPRALSFLQAVHEGDSWGLVTELEKLSFLNGRTLDQIDLEQLGLDLTPNLWNLVTHFKSPNLARRLGALEGILGSGEPAGKVFNFLIYQWPEKMPQFAAYDVAVKSGKLDYEEVLVDLAMS